MTHNSQNGRALELERLARRIGSKCFRDCQLVEACASWRWANEAAMRDLLASPEDLHVRRAAAMIFRWIRDFKITDCLPVIEEVVYGSLGRGADGEDDVQSAALRLLTNRNFLWIADAEAWRGCAAAAGRSAVIDRWRRTKTRRRYVSDGASDAIAVAPSHASPVPERVANKELVRQALARLPRHWADVLVLQSLEGFTVEEIAVRQGTTSGSAAGLLQRAKVRFRKLCSLAGG